MLDIFTRLYFGNFTLHKEKHLHYILLVRTLLSWVYELKNLPENKFSQKKVFFSYCLEIHQTICPFQIYFEAVICRILFTCSLTYIFHCTSILLLVQGEVKLGK